MKNLQYDKPKRNMMPVNSIYILLFILVIYAAGFIFGYLVGHFTAEPRIIYKDAPAEEVVEVISPVIEEPVEPQEPLKYYFTDADILLLSQLLCGQSGVDGDGEYDFETQIYKNNGEDINYNEIAKVLEVVMNRVLTPGVYANNIKDVVTQPGAFAVMPHNLNTTPSYDVMAVVREWCDSFNSPEYVRAIPEDHFWFSAGSRGSNVTRNHWN